VPYPPDRATSITFKEYMRTLEEYSRDASLRNKVLADKRQLEHFIDSLNSSESYVRKFFQYISSASVSELNFDARMFQRVIDDLPPFLHKEPELDKPLELWKRYLETTRDEMKRAIDEKGDGRSAAQQRAFQVASEVQAYLEAVRLLEERCEEDVKNHPTEEREIRRRYRQAIDALKDE
jgi:hypothetical protein